MPSIPQIQLNKIPRLLIKFFGVVVLGAFLYFLGTFTALLPQLMARAVLLPVVLCFIAFAFLSKSNKGISESILQVWLACMLATMALWPTYFIFKVGGLPSLDARRIIAALTLFSTIYFVISRTPVREHAKAVFSGPLRTGALILSVYVLLRIASCAASVNPIASFILVMWEVLYYYSMFFVGAILFSKPSMQSLTIKVMLTLAIIICSYSMMEWLLKKNLIAQFLPVSEDFAMFQKALTLSRIRDGFFRAQGTFEHPLLLAEFSAMMVSLGLSVFLWTKDNTKIKLLGGFVLCMALVTAVLTGSRSAFISVGAGIAVITTLWVFASGQFKSIKTPAMKKFMSVSVLTMMLVAAIPIVTLLVKGGSTLEAASTNVRLYMLKLGWESISSHPVIGVGPGTSGSVAGVLSGAGVGTLDNYYLAIAIESGLPAVFLLMMSLIYPAWIAFNQLMRGGNERQKVFQSALIGILIVALLVHAILWMPYNLFFAFLLSGMLLGSLDRKSNIES